MIQLILHGIGDYFLQTDYQALNKKKEGFLGLWCCLKHCTTYSIPFLFIGSYMSVIIIFSTHFIIDRTNLVAYLLAAKNSIYHKGENKNGKFFKIKIDSNRINILEWKEIKEQQH